MGSSLDVGGHTYMLSGHRQEMHVQEQAVCPCDPACVIGHWPECSCAGLGVTEVKLKLP